MIGVAGESLMDVLPGEAGQLVAVPGGAPFNVARIAAQIGMQCTFLGRLSDDPFGRRLRGELEAAGVSLALADPVTLPTTLAIAQLDAAGSADYRFYVDGTAAAALEPTDIPDGFLAGVRALALGGLGLVLEPIRSTLLALLATAPPELLVVLDPNCRPRAISDAPAYRATVNTALSRTDVLKVSREDIAFLAPAADPLAYCRETLAHGPKLVLMTDGPAPATLFTHRGTRSIPVPRVRVVDTIGAGDAMVAGLLAWFAQHPDVAPDAAELDLLESAVTAAAQVSAAVCTVRGAHLPENFTFSVAA
jgi:fructokinase